MCFVGDGALADEESPPLLPADDRATKNDVADGSILDAFLAHSESINDGLSLSLFSVEEKVQIDLLQTLKRLRAPLIAYEECLVYKAIHSVMPQLCCKRVLLTSSKYMWTSSLSSHL